ncbi:MAG: YfhO family protein, partial [Clostridiales bacterium]|nr:YfhO family protein [Clostridiales bacterium]
MRRLHVLSALIPMAIFAVMLGIMGIFPFGDRQILVVDAWHQYYPFISEFWHKLRGGDSLLWSWTAGGGHDYLAHIGYYLASPFNFLAALFPHSWLREIITLFVIVRIGLAGLAMSFYLRYTAKKHDLMLIAFATFYALCAWLISFYWNFMWLDSFALMPLVALGVHKLVRENRYGLYIIALALSVIFNFYIGFFICIFAAIMFFVLCVKYKPSLKVFFARFLTIIICSIIALGITAILTLPVFAALEHTGRSGIVFPTFALNHSFIDLLGNFVTLMPTARAPHGGFPNIYSGLLVAMLLPVFLTVKIPLREKIAYSAAVALILVSTNITVLNFIWHGFSVTHGLPYRYSFLISFFMIVMAYRAYTVVMLQEVRLKYILIAASGAIFFLILALIGQHNNLHILLLIPFALAYLALLKFKQLKIILLVLIVAELTLASHVGLVQGGATTDRGNFPWVYEDVRQVLAERTPLGADFYRTDFTTRWSSNDPSLYHFQGISIFSSLVNQNTLRFMNGLGLVNWAAANSYAFAETSPLTSAFLNVRYLVDRLGNPADDGVFWERAAQSNHVLLMRNTRPLALGFMTSPEIADFQGDLDNPFNSQNDLFRRATALDGDLFTFLPLTHGEQEISFTVPFSGEIYAYMPIVGSGNIAVISDETELRSVAIGNNAPHLFRVGSFEAGQSLTLRANAATRGEAFAGILNRELFERG